jgi:hypothetical protein
MVPHHRKGVAVEFHSVRAMRLGPGERGPVWPLHEGPAEGERPVLLVDVAPPKGKKLAPPSSGRGREPQVAGKRRVHAPHRLEQKRYLTWARWPDVGGPGSRWRRVRTGFDHIHSHRTACANARCNTPWIRVTVPGARGPPSRPPCPSRCP